MSKKPHDKKLKKGNIQKPPQFKASLPSFVYCLIIFAGLLIIYYYQLLAQKSFLWDDALPLYPLFSFTKECLKHFQLPLWNPYIYSGSPFFNDIGLMHLYPVNWFAFFLNGSAPLRFLQIELIPIFSMLIIGCFTYLLFKQLKLDWKISIFTGIVFMFSGYVSLRIFQIGPVVVFGWSILLLYYLIRILTQEKILDSVIGGILLGIAFFGSHPQFMIYIFYALTVYYIFHTILFHRQDLLKWLMTSLPRLLLFVAIGIGIAMVQYYPSLKYVPFTPRQIQTYVQTTDGSMLPSQLLTIFMPKFFGSASGLGTDTVPFWIMRFSHYYWESGIYLGILPFFLALFGIFYSPRKIKYIFFLIAGLALLFALGKYFPLYKIFWYIIPGLRRFRFPARFLSIYTLSMGILAAFGLEYMLSTGEKLKQHLLKFVRGLEIFLFFCIFMYIIMATGTLKGLSQYFSQPEIWSNCLKQFRIFLLFLFLTWLFFIGRRRLKAGMTFFVVFAGIISFVDLYQYGNKFCQSKNSPTDVFPRTRIVDFLQQERQKEIFRIKTREAGYMLLQRDESILWNLEAIEGYSPLSLERYMTFNVPSPRRNELLNVKYAINIDTLRKQMGIAENPNCLPRAFFCYDYRVAKNDMAILNLLASDTFDVSQIVVLEKEPSLRPEGQKGNVTVNIKHLQNDYLSVDVKTNQPGFLVLSEIYYSEWQARIDGNSTKIYRADYTLRAVYVPAGEHKIEMYYSKHNVNIGALITLITLIFSVAIGFISYQRTKQKKITS